ncbi:MAG: hypothetical protein NT092_08775 [Bacteroidia bacterium]|nr:hypothetical protein [Bacteroidia bacterium]
MRFNSGLIIAIIIAVAVASCRERGTKHIDQGEIHYAIEYGGNVGSFKEIMPKTLIVSFKDDKTLFDISAPIGNSGIYNLSNPEEKIFDTYISLLSWRYYYAAKQGETPPGFEAMKGMNIRKTSKSMQICGFNCKGAEVRIPSIPDRVFDIWYTNEIDIKNPNIANPFSEIDGVLMDFFFFMGDTEMKFNAETVYKKEISDKTFERKEKFQRISKKEIDEFMSKMLSL